MPVSVAISEAARRLGVSVDTVKRRIATGQLPARREPRPQGFRWLVELPDDMLPEAAPGHDDAGSVPDRGAETSVAVLRAEIARLEEQVRIMAAELDARRRETAELHQLLQEAIRGSAEEGGTAPAVVDAAPAVVIAPVASGDVQHPEVGRMPPWQQRWGAVWRGRRRTGS